MRCNDTSGNINTIDYLINFYVASNETGLGPGDINGDGVVNWGDIYIITRHMFHAMTDTRADANRDNQVDIFDLVSVAINWGNVY